MAYKYNDSEKFRAQLFLFTGSVLFTPLGVLILEKFKTNSNFLQTYWLFSITLAIVGLTSILYSYTIMINKDEAANGK